MWYLALFVILGWFSLPVNTRLIIRLYFWAYVAQYRYAGQFYTLEPNSIIEDLCLCLSNADVKLVQRIARLEYALIKFEGLISDELRDKARRVIHEAKTRAPRPEIARNVRELFVPDSDVFVENGLFDQYDIQLRDLMNSVVKARLNESGDVYDIMSCIAVLAFAEFIQCRRTGLKQQMVSGCCLIFKGGAAVGKYVLRGSTRSDMREIHDKFVKNGDNDMLLRFTYPSKFDAYSVFIAQKSLLEAYLDCVALVCEQYQLEHLLGPWIGLVAGSTYELCGTTLRIENAKSSSFSIEEYFEYDDHKYKKMVANTEETSIYFTRSHLDFITNQTRNNFFLGRVKKCYQVVSAMGERCSVFGELLDISVITPYNTKKKISCIRISPIKFPRFLLKSIGKIR